MRAYEVGFWVTANRIGSSRTDAGEFESLRVLNRPQRNRSATLPRISAVEGSLHLRDEPLRVIDLDNDGP